MRYNILAGRTLWPASGENRSLLLQLIRLHVGISHNAFSHRETSSQREQREECGSECGSDRRDGGEGVTDQRAWSRGREGKKGSAPRAAEFLLSKWSFCLAFHLSHNQRNPPRRGENMELHFCFVCMRLHWECVLLYTVIVTVIDCGHY